MLFSMASMAMAEAEAEPYNPFWIERGLHGPVQIIRYDHPPAGYYHKREADADAYHGYHGYGHGHHAHGYGHRHHGYGHHGYHGHRHHGYGHHGYHGYPHYGYLYGK